MLVRCVLLALCLLPLAAAVHGEARQWSDTTGRYTTEAELIAASNTTAVLETAEKELKAVAIDQLSEADREFINQWHEQQESADPQAPHVWTMRSGLQVKGWAVAYDRRDITLQRHRGKLYVNDKRFDNLPEIYQKMIPKIVGHFEQQEIETTKELMDWARKLKAAPYTVTVDGVMLELESGDRYLVPFFFFSAKDMQLLEPGWQRWLAEKDEAEARERENFLLRAQTEAYHQNQQQQQQMTQLHLQMLAVDSGIVDLWKVTLVPQRGNRQMGGTVVVPARNSRDAAQAALAAHPGFNVGPIARVNR
jgi:hypothetical protein